MENLFKKFFKGEARLVSEWPPSVPSVNNEREDRLNSLRTRLDGLNKNKDWNDWTQADRDSVRELELDIKRLEDSMKADGVPDPADATRLRENLEEERAVNQRMEALTKRVRGK